MIGVLPHAGNGFFAGVQYIRVTPAHALTKLRAERVRIVLNAGSLNVRFGSEQKCREEHRNVRFCATSGHQSG
jgi:hypothetical protein